MQNSGRKLSVQVGRDRYGSMDNGKGDGPLWAVGSIWPEYVQVIGIGIG